MPVFDLPLVTATPISAGFLRITYGDKGFMYADYYLAGLQKLPDRLYSTMLQSTLFAPVMEQINAAIENNRDSLKQDHSHLNILPS
jgi:hypothetical protein